MTSLKFTEIVSIPLKRLRELEYLSFHDDMTKLKNRHFLFREVQITDYSFLYFIDINGLKKVNESGGHFAGDNHIRKIVKDIKSYLNKNDLFIRYAGDEFIVLSNDDNKLETTFLYSVGKTKTNNKLVSTITKANKNLVVNRKLFREKEEKLIKLIKETEEMVIKHKQK